MTRSVLVTGARGKTGREVVRQLASEPNVEVRAGSSRPYGAETDPAARSIRFDWLEVETWDSAVADVDAIYLMRPDLENADDLHFLQNVTRDLRGQDAQMSLPQNVGRQLSPSDWVELRQQLQSGTCDLIRTT